MSDLPDVNKAHLERLESLQHNIEVAKGTLEANSIVLTVLVGEPVEMNKKLRHSGEKVSIRFLEDGSFRFGSHRFNVQLKGIEQQKWQTIRKDSQIDLDQLLENLQLESFQQATEIYTKRQTLESKLESAKQELRSFATEGIEELELSLEQLQRR